MPTIIVSMMMLNIFIILTIFIIREKILKRRHVQSVQSLVVEESAIYEDIESRRPEMADNVAYSIEQIQKETS